MSILYDPHTKVHVPCYGDLNPSDRQELPYDMGITGIDAETPNPGVPAGLDPSDFVINFRRGCYRSGIADSDGPHRSNGMGSPMGRVCA